MSRNLTVVIKGTKLCNMRCTYCYEFEHLGDSARVEERSFDRLFGVLRDIELALDAEMKFCWHGGEPTLLGPTYYETAKNAQTNRFSGSRRHLIQTNLFALNARTWDTLNQFDDVSISFDVRGEERQDIGGSQTRSRVVENMDRLREAGTRFGAINVLHRANVGYIEDIFAFYNAAGISFRLLPYYREASSASTEQHGLTSKEVRDAMLSMVDLWFTHSFGQDISPVAEFVRIAMRYYADVDERYVYNKRVREHVIMIDTNGDLYTAGTAYSSSFSYGNIFRDDAEAILSSEGRQRAIERAETLMSDCQSCEYFGFCPGYMAAEQTDVELRAKQSSGCTVVKPCIDRALDWIRTAPVSSLPPREPIELGEVT